MHLYNRLGKPHFNFKGDLILSPEGKVTHNVDVNNVKVLHADNIVKLPLKFKAKLKLTIRVLRLIW